MDLDHVTSRVIGCAMKVHTKLGPGLLESTYEACLLYELRKEGLRVSSQVTLPVLYEDAVIDAGYRLDILVEDAIIVELKVVEQVLPVHKAQVLTYLRLSSKKIGLLINFNVPHLRDGIVRLAN